MVEFRRRFAPAAHLASDAPALARLAIRRDRRALDVVAARSDPRSPWEQRIANVRAQLAQSTDAAFDDVTIGQHTTMTSVHPRWGKFLYQLVRRRKPIAVVEMGTSVGISASYIGGALEDLGAGRLITLEGAPAVADTARWTLDALGLSRVEVRTGTFVDTLGKALADVDPVGLMFVDGHHQEGPTWDYFQMALPHLADDAVMVFDDITWSEGMGRAWSRIEQDERTAFAVSLGRVGVWAPCVSGARWLGRT